LSSCKYVCTSVDCKFNTFHHVHPGNTDFCLLLADDNRLIAAKQYIVPCICNRYAKFFIAAIYGVIIDQTNTAVTISDHGYSFCKNSVIQISMITQVNFRIIDGQFIVNIKDKQTQLIGKILTGAVRATDSKGLFCKTFGCCKVKKKEPE